MLKGTALLAIVAVLVTPSCSFDPPGRPRLGIGVNGQAIVIRYISCGEVVKAVRLFEIDDDQIAPDGDGDREIWESEDPVVLSLIGDGVTPGIDGQQLALNAEARYWVDVESADNIIGSEGFALRDIEGGMVWSEEGNVTEADFEQRAAESCNT